MQNCQSFHFRKRMKSAPFSTKETSIVCCTTDCLNDKHIEVKCKADIRFTS
uniref:Uncharacterized protein n=1 Tax=Rhizophora mucronata TaxID=61149 RepID=A0A2P2MXQ0_RHIMU